MKTAQQETGVQLVHLPSNLLKAGEVILSTETSVQIQTTRRYIPEGGYFHNYSCESLKSYI
jgi:hypothetical protein